MDKSTKTLVSTGLFFAFVFALPLFVWSAINVNFNVNERAQGEPNSCGGTCGSNYNCKMDYYCFNGFCRNPLCSDSTDCVCRETKPSPITTAKPTSKALPTTTSVPKGGNETIEPISTTKAVKTEVPKVSTTEVPQVQIENVFLYKYAIYAFYGFALIAIIVSFYAIKRSTKN